MNKGGEIQTLTLVFCHAKIGAGGIDCGIKNSDELGIQPLLKPQERLS